MSLRKKQKQEREKRKHVERQIRQSKRKLRYGTIFVLAFLASIIPYAIGLWNQPNLWNGILFLALSIGGCAAIIYITKNAKL